MSRLKSLGLLLVVAAIPGLRCASAPAADPRPLLRIYLARHGQTDWNAARRLQGGTDVPLNATGRRQAEALREKLGGLPIDQVYASRLARSRETAEIARGAAPLEILPALNEQSLGRFEGLVLEGGDPAAVAEYERRSRDPDDSLDGGESAEAHYARVRQAVEAIRARHTTGVVLIVGHGGTNAMILRALLGLSADQTEAIHQANDELYLIEMAPASPPRLWKQIPPDRLGDL